MHISILLVHWTSSCSLLELLSLIVAILTLIVAILTLIVAVAVVYPPLMITQLSIEYEALQRIIEHRGFNDVHKNITGEDWVNVIHVCENIQALKPKYFKCFLPLYNRFISSRAGEFGMRLLYLPASRYLTGEWTDVLGDEQWEQSREEYFNLWKMYRRVDPVKLERADEDWRYENSPDNLTTFPLLKPDEIFLLWSTFGYAAGGGNSVNKDRAPEFFCIKNFYDLNKSCGQFLRHDRIQKNHRLVRPKPDGFSDRGTSEDGLAFVIRLWAREEEFYNKI